MSQMHSQGHLNQRLNRRCRRSTTCFWRRSRRNCNLYHHSSALHKVKHLAVDAPTAMLVEELRKVLPSLQGNSLDATHIAMRYEESSASRKTQGSMLLRQFLHKFQGRGPRLGSDMWGPMFAGKDARRLSAQEEGLRFTLPGPKLPAKCQEHELHVSWPQLRSC